MNQLHINQRRHAHWQKFLKALAAATATPGTEHLTARCWTRRDLASLFVCLGQGANVPRRFSNAEGFLSYLQEIGWTQVVEVTRPAQRSSDVEFYLLDPSAAVLGAQPDPLELLQAYRPAGALCYFTALAFHSLTTQLPSHHHIALPGKATLPSATNRSNYSGNTRDDRARFGTMSAPNAMEVEPRLPTRSRDALGRAVFHYQDIPCYVHRRGPNLLRGTQVREVGPRTRLRVTTREQTLLDGLRQPKACGGTATVLEAWETALSEGLDEERLAECLTTTNHRPTSRRVGALLEMLNHSPAHGLDGLLASQRLSADEQQRLGDTPTTNVNDQSEAATPGLALPLLPGSDEFSRLRPKWGVLVP